MEEKFEETKSMLEEMTKRFMDKYGDDADTEKMTLEEKVDFLIDGFTLLQLEMNLNSMATTLLIEKR